MGKMLLPCRSFVAPNRYQLSRAIGVVGAILENCCFPCIFVMRIEEKRDFASNFLENWQVAGNHRDSALQCFNDRNAEALDETWQQYGPRLGKPGKHRMIVAPSEFMDVAL